MIRIKQTVFAFFIILISSCTKIDTTDLGQNLIPPVDGVNTLATDTFTISTENGIFNDTSVVFKTDDHVLGNLQPTANFGNTNASVFVQFNPQTKFGWAAAKDSISSINVGTTVQGLDSAFVCLGFNPNNSFYGDTTSNITFKLYRIRPTQKFRKDTAYKIAQDPASSSLGINALTDDGVEIGAVTIAPKDLRKFNLLSLKQRKDSTNNQIRIRLNATGLNWVRSNWLQEDSTASGAFNNRDNFVAKNNGFVIKASNGNCLMNVQLASNFNSRFEVWYKYKKNGQTDTTAQFFYFNSNLLDPWVSASANYVKRDLAGSNLQASATAGADNLVYIESTPGSFTKIKLPFLKSFPNKMIHRAELIIEEDPTFRNNTFYAPSRLFLDCFDTTLSVPERFVSVPFDYYFVSGNVDFSYFGGDRRNVGIGSNARSSYNFNLTKYFQDIITRNGTNFNLRLFAPFDTRSYSQLLGYYSNFPSTFDNNIWPLVNPTAFGRVVVGGGNHPNYKMKLRVIYSNL